MKIDIPNNVKELTITMTFGDSSCTTSNISIENDPRSDTRDNSVELPIVTNDISPKGATGDDSGENGDSKEPVVPIPEEMTNLEF